MVGNNSVTKTESTKFCLATDVIVKDVEKIGITFVIAESVRCVGRHIVQVSTLSMNVWKLSMIERIYNLMTSLMVYC